MMLRVLFSCILELFEPSEMSSSKNYSKITAFRFVK